jgi:broad specificity phosphatase PhoE
MVLILLRHGRTPANAARLLQGRIDQDLDEVGIEQAAAAFEYISSTCKVDAVIASPLKRAQQTAEAFGMSIEVEDRWLELSYGEYEGTPHGEVPSEVWRKWRDDPTFAPVGGESLAALGVRVRSACDDLVERAAISNIVVVSHVSPIKSAVAWALDVADISSNSHLDQAAICRVVFRDRHPILQTFNETAPANARRVIQWG